MELTHRQRILNALYGKEVDRTPWSPFLAYYWDHLPLETREQGQLEYLKKMGADPILRGFHNCYETKYENCDITEKWIGNKRYKTFDTKVGKLVSEYSAAENAKTTFLTGHPVKDEEDFKVLQYIYENMTFEDMTSRFEAEKKKIGEDGLLLPAIGVWGKTAFQSLVEYWCGTENLVYALADFPETVEECLAVMREKDMETVNMSVKSSADAFMFFEDSSTTNISPSLFSQYTAPEIKEWSDALHSNGRLLIHHACGHLKDIIPQMCEAGIDMIESMSPPPTGNIDITDAAKLMPDRVGIIGGIEPVFFRSCTIEQLEARVLELLEGMRGRRYILANSDSCPPDVEYEKFLLVSETVKKFK